MADYLETAAIDQTINTGPAVIHIGRTGDGFSFVLVNDNHGRVTLVEDLS